MQDEVFNEIESALAQNKPLVVATVAASRGSTPRKPGAKMAVLQGDPSKAGVYTVRLKAGDGYKIAPHFHPTTENVTVISGVFNIGAGDKMDTASTTALVPGGFASLPAKMHHYAWFKGETEVQVHGVGPFKLTYVNPKDDPTKAKK